MKKEIGCVKRRVIVPVIIVYIFNPEFSHELVDVLIYKKTISEYDVVKKALLFVNEHNALWITKQSNGYCTEDESKNIYT